MEKKCVVRAGPAFSLSCPAILILEFRFTGKDTGSIPGQEGPLEEGMAAHSSVLAWRTPWTEEPGSYSPQGCKESERIEAT